MSNHLGLDLDIVEGLSIVDSNHTAYHLGHHDHVAEVCANCVGLVCTSGLLQKVWQCSHQNALKMAGHGEREAPPRVCPHLLCLSQTLDESERLALKTPLEAAPASMLSLLVKRAPRYLQIVLKSTADPMQDEPHSYLALAWKRSTSWSLVISRS